MAFIHENTQVIQRLQVRKIRLSKHLIQTLDAGRVAGWDFAIRVQLGNIEDDAEYDDTEYFDDGDLDFEAYDDEDVMDFDDEDFSSDFEDEYSDDEEYGWKWRWIVKKVCIFPHFFGAFIWQEDARTI